LRSYKKSGVLDEIRKAGGEVFAITSEPQSLATEAQDDWEFGFPCIGDPHHEIREVLSEQGWIDVFYNEDYGHLRHRAWASHPKGYYQPAVIALTRDEQVLYRWRCVPKFSNMAGAGGRPEARYTWDKMQAGRTGSADAPPDRDPLLGSKEISWPYFLLIMLAHGWFLRPKVFPLGREEDSRSAKANKMMGRVFGFAAVWAAAFVLLPATWSIAAAAAWLIAMTPGVIEIHRQVQNEPDPY
jgi:hypothetical protein